MPPRSSPKPASPRSEGWGTTPRGLSVRAAPARLVALLREHDQLLRKIAHKKRALATLTQEIEEVSRRTAVAQPVVEECAALDREIHALFAALLSRKRQPNDVRRLLLVIYGMLQDGGVLTPSEDLGGGPEDGGEDAADWDARPYGTETGAKTGAERGGHSAPPPPRSGGFSARRPGDELANQSLRALFRALATALHPDKVPDEAEKARRTEVMKEISRAYEERDLARLLDLKRIWMAGADSAAGNDVGAGAPDEDEIDRRCANLERMNVALRAQRKQLTRELKLLRGSPQAEILKDLRRSSRGARGEDPIAALLAGAQAELDRLRELRDFVVAYRDGKITIDELLRGPPSMRAEAPSGDDADLEFDGDDADSDPRSGVDFDSLLDRLFDPVVERPSAPPPPRSRRRRRRRGNRAARAGQAPPF